MAEVVEVAAGVGGTMAVHQIAEGATHFIHVPQITAKTLRVLTETTETGAIIGTVGVEATRINNQHIHQDPLTRRLSNNSMEDMEDMAVAGLPEDDHHRIMVVMDLAVVDLLRPEAVLLIMALRMDKVDTAGMERLIIMDIAVVIVTMVDMALITDMGIKVEVEEVHHTMPRLVGEAGLGSYICIMLYFM